MPAMGEPVFVDVESTGLYPERGHALYEVGLIEAGGTEHRWWVKPDLAMADPVALRIGRYYQRLPEKVDPVARVAKEIAHLTAGRHLVGACPWFDAAMFEAFLRRHGQAPAWHFRHRCVESLAMGRTGRDIEGLRAAAEALGIPVDDAELHTALGDTRVAKAIYDAVMGRP
jgi:DNA polymerase III epsilon subunit-like protein